MRSVCLPNDCKIVCVLTPSELIAKVNVTLYKYLIININHNGLVSGSLNNHCVVSEFGIFAHGLPILTVKW